MFQTTQLIGLKFSGTFPRIIRESSPENFSSIDHFENFTIWDLAKLFGPYKVKSFKVILDYYIETTGNLT